VTRKWALVLGLAFAAVIVGAGLSWLAPRFDIPTTFWLSPIGTVSVGDRQLRVVRAESYAQGLHGVATLGGLDGMLFAFSAPVTSPNGMGMSDDVLMALDVTFFDSEGRLIDRFTMQRCAGADCPGYSPRRDWQYAIEAPAGSLDWVKSDAILAPLPGSWAITPR
jgi:uncharacterized membrane protein (UPF0127 family)